MKEPLIFTPLLKTRVWGGEVLKSRAPNPPSEPVGESWELADHGKDTTVVASGTYAGQSLHELFLADRQGLCGEAIDPASPGIFPLMLKIIDPREDLSVQVHPDDAYAARETPGELGKTEAWYVLHARPGSRIYKGVKPGVTQDRFAAALREGTVAHLLHSFEAKAGDVVLLPAGAIHALGAGVQIAEIQQNSDTTYRVFDWNRLGLDGKPRELHVNHALAVSDFSSCQPDRCIPIPLSTPHCRHERLLACEKFVWERIREMVAPVTLDTQKKTFHIVTVVEGEVEIETEGGKVMRRRWDTCLIPAVSGCYEVRGTPETILLIAYRPSRAWSA